MVALSKKYPRWHRRRHRKHSGSSASKNAVKQVKPVKRKKTRPKRKKRRRRTLMRRIDDALLAKTSAPPGFKRMYMQPYRPPPPDPVPAIVLAHAPGAVWF